MQILIAVEEYFPAVSCVMFFQMTEQLEEKL